MEMIEDIKRLKDLLTEFKKEGKILLAYLFGSHASDMHHKRSDIDLALYLNTADNTEREKIIDAVLMSSEIHIDILLLEDEDESPFIVQQAIKGIPLVDPDLPTLYTVAHKALHEAESIRYKRMPVSA